MGCSRYCWYPLLEGGPPVALSLCSQTRLKWIPARRLIMGNNRMQKGLGWTFYGKLCNLAPVLLVLKYLWWAFCDSHSILILTYVFGVKIFGSSLTFDFWYGGRFLPKVQMGVTVLFWRSLPKTRPHLLTACNCSISITPKCFLQCAQCKMTLFSPVSTYLWYAQSKHQKL